MNRDGKGPEGKGCGTGGKQGRLAGNTKVKEESKILNFCRGRHGKRGPMDGRGQGRGQGRGLGPRDGRGGGRYRKVGETNNE